MATESKLRLVHVVTIFLVFQAVTIANASRYALKGNSENGDNGKRRSSLAIGVAGGTVGEDYGDLSDSEYLRRAIKTLSLDVSSLRRTVRDLYRSELSAIRKTVDRIADAQAYATMRVSLQPTRYTAPVLSPNSVASLLGLSNIGAIAESPLSSGVLGVAHAGAGLSNYGAGGPSYRDELAQLVDANLVQQAAGKFENQANTFGQLLSGYKESSALSSGLGTGTTSSSGVPTQLLLSSLG